MWTNTTPCPSVPTQSASTHLDPGPIESPLVSFLGPHCNRNQLKKKASTVQKAPPASNVALAHLSSQAGTALCSLGKSLLVRSTTFRTCRQRLQPATLFFSTSTSAFFFIFLFAYHVPLLILWGYSSALHFHLLNGGQGLLRQMNFTRKHYTIVTAKGPSTQDARTFSFQRYPSFFIVSLTAWQCCASYNPTNPLLQTQDWRKQELYLSLPDTNCSSKPALWACSGTSTEPAMELRDSCTNQAMASSPPGSSCLQSVACLCLSAVCTWRN